MAANCFLKNKHRPGIFIVAAKRTPFGKFGGALKDVHQADLLAAAAQDVFRNSGIAPALVDTVNVGQVYGISGSADGGLSARHAALKSGVPETRPALAVNRLCGSGFQAVINSAQDILTGTAQISLAGGTESMSLVPYVVRNARFGIPLGSSIEFEDVLGKGSVDTYCNFNMAETAENLAEKFKLKREEVDEFALLSQQRWKKAHDSGVFKAELTPVTVKVRKREVVVDKDEHPRPETTAEGLAKLPVLFRKGGVLTAGNSSGVNDGAGALLLASEEAMCKHQLSPLARLVGWSYVGVDPSIMGIGPVPAIENLLKVTNMKLDDIDLIEINEAFSPQTLACVKSLGIDQSRLNVNGGAIALGHPVGASGARITAHLTHELRRRGLKTAIGSACIGGGQGIALLLETV
ncbi:PREDICTED: 3-ketoacyl-CoA thiolase, mitochondrial-like [Papilio polytes]|uniref:3-ketoacyl-CoA thiolase, mitochondrial-like n=1 Tax=Papilio polytes TaxID=76194 RepID=UPI0006767543|nr:PREDICTED: 3-ketoacyl-CoA thiolase, mitochondrial-like [Papilio polytes]